MRDLLLFISDLTFNLQPLLSDLLNFLLFHFPSSEALVLLNATLPVLVQFLDVGLLSLETDFVLLCPDPSLPRFFLFREHRHLLDSFLFKSVFFFHPVDSVLRLISPHVVVLHFFNFGTDSLLVLLFQSHDLSGLLFCLFNLFPCFHLFLLEKSNTIGE